MSGEARAIADALARIEAGQRELLAELRRKRKAPAKRAASVARRARERVASAAVPITDLDRATVRRYLSRRRR